MKRLFLVIGLIAFPFIAQADHDRHDYRRSHHPHHFWNKVERRVDRQHHRIERGIRSGALTHRETKKLKREHRRIVRLIEHNRHEHRLSHHDRRKIIGRLDHASDHIFRLVNNRHAGHGRSHHHDHHLRDTRRTAFADAPNRWFYSYF